MERFQYIGIAIWGRSEKSIRIQSKSGRKGWNVVAARLFGFLLLILSLLATARGETHLDGELVAPNLVQLMLTSEPRAIILGNPITIPLPRPLQPFLVELLSQERGSWIFTDANGQEMKHEGVIRKRKCMHDSADKASPPGKSAATSGEPSR